MITAGLGSGTSRNFTVIHTNHHTSKNIALLKVKPSISPSHAMRPICLPIRQKGRESTNQATGSNQTIIYLFILMGLNGKELHV